MSNCFVIIACQAPVSMEFSKPEYWSGMPFLLQGIFPTQGSNLNLLYWQSSSLRLSHQESPFSARIFFYFSANFVGFILISIYNIVTNTVILVKLFLSTFLFGPYFLLLQIMFFLRGKTSAVLFTIMWELGSSVNPNISFLHVWKYNEDLFNECITSITGKGNLYVWSLRTICISPDTWGLNIVLKELMPSSKILISKSAINFK